MPAETITCNTAYGGYEYRVQVQQDGSAKVQERSPAGSKFLTRATLSPAGWAALKDRLQFDGRTECSDPAPLARVCDPLERYGDD
jgi:hypothetical protein